MDKANLKQLLTFFDDTDEVFHEVLKELIKNHSHELPYILSQLQETENKIIRKRVHQIEACLKFHNRRNNLKDFINNKPSDKPLIFWLKELHFLWFDKDDELELENLWQNFLQDFTGNKSSMLGDLAFFFKNNQLVAYMETSLNTNIYLIGTILDEKIGASSALCAMAKAIAEQNGCNFFDIILLDGDFCLLDKNSNRYFNPKKNWQIKFAPIKEYETFSSVQIMKYFLGIAFSNSISLNTFRYAHIFGDILNSNKSNLDFLPYPYGTQQPKD